MQKSGINDDDFDVEEGSSGSRPSTAKNAQEIKSSGRSSKSGSIVNEVKLGWNIVIHNIGI